MLGESQKFATRDLVVTRHIWSSGGVGGFTSQAGDISGLFREEWVEDAWPNQEDTAGILATVTH